MSSPASAKLPVLLGIRHHSSASALAAEKKVISTFIDGGARSVGLEISSRALQHAPHLKSSFTTFAEYASSRGLAVVPLLSDEVAETRTAYSLMTSFVTRSSAFDIERIDLEVVQLEQEAAFYQKRVKERYAPPEVASPGLLAATQRRLERMRAVETYARELGGDLDLFARLWEEWIIRRGEADMKSAIAEKRPDLVVVGAAHAIPLSSVGGYEVSIQRDLDAYHALPAVSGAPRLETTLQEFAEKKSKESASLIYRHLTGIAVENPVRNDDSNLHLERALAREPDLFYLALRVLYHTERACVEDFVPHEDIDHFKITAYEAERRILAALSTLP